MANSAVRVLGAFVSLENTLSPDLQRLSYTISIRSVRTRVRSTRSIAVYRFALLPISKKVVPTATQTKGELMMNMRIALISAGAILLAAFSAPVGAQDA